MKKCSAFGRIGSHQASGPAEGSTPGSRPCHLPTTSSGSALLHMVCMHIRMQLILT